MSGAAREREDRQVRVGHVYGQEVGGRSTMGSQKKGKHASGYGELQVAGWIWRASRRGGHKCGQESRLNAIYNATVSCLAEFTTQKQSAQQIN